MSRRIVWWLAAAALAGTACIDWVGAREAYCAGGGAGCPADAGPDAGLQDAGGMDAGDTDAGGEDAGADAGSDDAGTDAGAVDAGPVRLTFVVVVGDGGTTGRIEWFDGGLACDDVASPCAVDVARGADLEVRGEPGTWGVLTGFSGCDVDQPFGRCALTALADATITATFDRPNLLFVTSGGYPLGTFSREPDGGTNADVVARANTICADVAADAGLPGTFLAFLGRAGYDPTAASRIGAGRGWIRVDGRPVFDDLSLPGAAAAPLFPPALSERGDLIPINERIGTGMSRLGGVATNKNCNDFNSSQGSIHLASGFANMGGAAWFDDGAAQVGCGINFHLACFGIDRRVPVRVDRSRPTRLAFVTATAFIPGDGGLAAADALCAQEAVTEHGHDGGVFNAYLFEPGPVVPTARLGSSSVPWARPDGVVVVPLPALFRSSQGAIGPQAPLSNEDTARFWIGVANATCSGWTDGANTSQQPQLGRAWVSAGNWDSVIGAGRCNGTSNRLACFER